jgi:hypothetical protein
VCEVIERIHLRITQVGQLPQHRLEPPGDLRHHGGLSDRHVGGELVPHRFQRLPMTGFDGLGQRQRSVTTSHDHPR